ncbi:MAG: class I tRNA ligase family protein [Minisyncoccota bacterium]
MKEYEPKDIEPKWQKFWDEKNVFEAKKPKSFSFFSKPKFYALIEFPYPSGDGLHVGHPRPYIGMDVVARKKRMEGYNVLYPIGWDAFGLPTENYAIKTGKNPKLVTKENTDTFRRQIKSLGVSFDWSREINTTDPKYYKWTQWLFLKFLEKGLAYKAKMAINWCPRDKIGLANEEVIDGRCERCGTPVERREKEQWMLGITKYADRLHKDLDDVDFPERVKAQQRNWIGKSEGAEIDFALSNERVKVFTTRPDTIFGATYLVLAPEHELVEKLKDKIQNWDEVSAYIRTSKEKTDIVRTAESKDKTGVELKGVMAINPASKEEIPVWVADYVLPHYGTGAIMAVPAHDERDNEFAKKYGLQIKNVIAPSLIDNKNPHVPGKKIVFRKAVMGIVRNPKTGKVLILKWKTQPWTTFVMGGIEGDEDPVVAAKREIEEETGYKNLKLVRVLGGPTQADFYAAHKGVNRTAQTWSVLFELENEEKSEISAEEAAIHEVVWMPWVEVKPELITHVETEIILDRINSGIDTYTGSGVLIGSGHFDQMKSEEAKEKITEAVGGKWVTKFKLRDWVFSRQRYWGEPIPVIHCSKCGIVPVPEKDLPVELPKVDRYEPTDTGESPLASVLEWVNTKCPKCGGDAKRETDTMPNWAGSSWYFLRYTDPFNDKEFASKKNLKHWMPVDWYNGGMEHTTLHLLYSRFWNKFLFDLGLVATSEPYKKRTSHGIILAANGEKMSKSKGNVVNPDSIVERFGADTLRLYEMFMGPFEQAIAWNDDSLVGPRRFLERVWKLQTKVSEAEINEQALHSTVKKVSEDIESMGFNTAVSALMVWVNLLEKKVAVSETEYKTLLMLLAPFAPHISEELWQILKYEGSPHTTGWPEFDEKKIVKEMLTYAIQVNGKVRADISVSRSTSKENVQKMALEMPEIKKWIDSKEVQKIIVVPNKVVNIVVS